MMRITIQSVSSLKTKLSVSTMFLNFDLDECGEANEDGRCCSYWWER
ncbi:hypothetical protein HanOQP8_Chr17g0660791 [Helianthus annuus]|nr:hypothetical protein HanOQP8_Chr17g0660791 [Helianthus annuus]